MLPNPLAIVHRVLRDPGQLAIVAQPIIDLERRAVTGYEALARFPEGLRPDLVFAAAHAAGVGPALTAIALGNALALPGRPANTFLTLNVDPNYVCTEPVQAVLAAQTLAGIVLEMTEHSPFDDMNKLRAQLDELRSRGAIVALDDAGVGHSGLRQLLELRPEIVKLDRALVADISHDESKRTLVAMIGELANRFDAWLLAEGIETEAEHDAIVKLGVPLAQGYYYGRPAAPWARLDETLLRVAPPRDEAAATISRLVQPSLTVPRDAVAPASSPAVVLDATNRPAGMWVASELGPRLRVQHQLTRCRRDTRVTDAIRRILARPERLRWDPLVCIDDLGHFVGVIAAERLVEALLP